jgi:D-alanyl-D-alanine carboxypeptidase
LPAILDEMLTTSDDNTAELLVKEIGFAVRGDGSREAGLAVIRDVLEEWGMPLDAVAFADGSGLSNNNRVTCSLLVGVLQHGAHDDPVGEGLPVAGVSGTLAQSFDRHRSRDGCARRPALSTTSTTRRRRPTHPASARCRDTSRSTAEVRSSSRSC